MRTTDQRSVHICDNSYSCVCRELCNKHSRSKRYRNFKWRSHHYSWLQRKIRQLDLRKKMNSKVGILKKCIIDELVIRNFGIDFMRNHGKFIQCLQELKFRHSIMNEYEEYFILGTFNHNYLANIVYPQSWVYSLPNFIHNMFFDLGIEADFGEYAITDYGDDEYDRGSDASTIQSGYDSMDFLDFSDFPFTDSDSSSTSYSDVDVFSHLDYHQQTEPMEYKDYCVNTFKEKRKCEKKRINKVVDKIDTLSKAERKRLIALLKKMEHQSGPINTIMELIMPHFKKFPFLTTLFLEILTVSTGIYLSTTREQVIFYIMASITKLAIGNYDYIRDTINSLFYTEQNGEDFGSLLKSGLERWKGFADNKVVDDIKRGIMILVSLGFSGVKGLAEHLPNLKDMLKDSSLIKITSFDIVTYALELILSLYERVRAVVETKELKSFFIPMPRLYDLSNRYDSIKAKYSHAMAGNLPDHFNESIDDYDFEVRVVHREMVRLARVCSVTDRVTVNHWKKDLASIIADLDYYHSTQPIRRQPFSLNLIGGSGVGKTNLVTIFSIALAKCYGFKVTKDSFHYRKSNDQYYSGYNGQRIIVEDDKNATKATPGGVDENAETINIANNAVMPLNKAAVDDKGRFTMKADIHIMTTNKGDAQAQILSNEPAAVLRRSIHLVVEVKPEFRLGQTTMLDPSKCAGRPLEDDAWLFTVLDVEVYTRSMNVSAAWAWKTVSHNGKLMNRVDIHDVLIYLKDTCTTHIIQQNRIISGFNDLLANTELCEHGSGPNICRICLHIPEYISNRDSVDMGHTHMNKPCQHGRGNRECQQCQPLVVQSGICSFIVKQCFNVVWYSLMPWVVIIANLFKNMSCSFWIGWIIQWSGIGASFMTNDSLYITEVVDRFIWRWSFSAYLLIWIPFYSSIAILSTFMYGFSALTCVLWGDALACLLNRIGLRFLHQVNHDGARGTIRRMVECRVRVILEHKLFYPAITGAVVAALAAYKLINRPKMREQGSIVSIPETNGWAKPYVPPEDIPLRRQSATFLDLHTRVSNTIAHVWLYKDGSTIGAPGNMYPICSGAWIMPAHFVYGVDGKFLDYTHMNIKLNSSPLGNSLRSVPIDFKLIRRLGDSDCCVIYVPCTAGQMRDMRDYFTDNHKDVSASYAYRLKDGNLMDGDLMVRLRHVTEHALGEKYINECSFNTFPGLCGAIQVANTKFPYIASIHTHGIQGTTSAACTPIYKHQLIEALESLFEDKFAIQTGSMQDMDFTDGDPRKVISKDIHAKSPFNHMESGSVYYLGRLAERSKPSANVINTAISGDVEIEFDTVNCFGPPSFMRSWKPKFAAASNLVNPVFKDPKLWREAIEMQHNSILDALKKLDILEAQPLDDATTLAGLDGDDTMKRMDTSTSSGYPMRVLKSSFLTASYHPEDKRHQWHLDVNDEYKKRIDNVVDRCDKGLRPNCIFSSNLKNEPKTVRELDDNGEWVPKVSMPRVFYASSFELTFLMRRYFMPIIKIIMRAVESEMSIGINAMGPDWGKLAERLLRVSKFILEADQSKFDQGVTADELIPQYKFWIHVAQLCGYCRKDLRIMRNLVGCIICPIIDFDSDLVMFYSLAISGSFGTAQVNSSVNGARFKAFFMYLYYSDIEFKRVVDEYETFEIAYSKLVCANFFGDDSLVSVSSHISDKFNMKGFANFMGKYGVTVTTASKGVVEKDLMNLSEVDYLKRAFRYDEERKVWTAPLNEKSMLKRMMVCIPSNFMTHEEQCAEALVNSLRDYFEYGREVFDDRRDKLLRIAIKNNLLTHINKFYSYDDLVVEYNEKYGDSPAAMRG